MHRMIDAAVRHTARPLCSPHLTAPTRTAVRQKLMPGGSTRTVHIVPPSLADALHRPLDPSRPAMVTPPLTRDIRPIEMDPRDVVDTLQPTFAVYNANPYSKIDTIAAYLAKARADQDTDPAASPLKSLLQFDPDANGYDAAVGANCAGTLVAMRAALPAELSPYLAVSPHLKLHPAPNPDAAPWRHVGGLFKYITPISGAEGFVFADTSLAHPTPFVVPFGGEITAERDEWAWKVWHVDDGQNADGHLRAQIIKAGKTVWDYRADVFDLLNPSLAITRETLTTENVQTIKAKNADGRPIATVLLDRANDSLVLLRSEPKSKALLPLDTVQDPEAVEAALAEMFPDCAEVFGRPAAMLAGPIAYVGQHEHILDELGREVRARRG